MYWPSFCKRLNFYLVKFKHIYFSRFSVFRVFAWTWLFTWRFLSALTLHSKHRTPTIVCLGNDLPCWWLPRPCWLMNSGCRCSTSFWVRHLIMSSCSYHFMKTCHVKNQAKRDVLFCLLKIQFTLLVSEGLLVCLPECRKDWALNMSGLSHC